MIFFVLPLRMWLICSFKWVAKKTPRIDVLVVTRTARVYGYEKSHVKVIAPPQQTVLLDGIPGTKGFENGVMTSFIACHEGTRFTFFYP